MSAASNYLENELLDHVLRGAAGAWSAPATVYLGLFTNTSTNAAANLEANIKTDEVGGTGYTRQSVSFAVAASGSTSNSATITFGPAGSNWGTVTHVAVMDASTSGNVLFWGAIASTKTIDSGDTFQITSGNLTISLS